MENTSRESHLQSDAKIFDIHAQLCGSNLQIRPSPPKKTKTKDDPLLPSIPPVTGLVWVHGTLHHPVSLGRYGYLFHSYHAEDIFAGVGLSPALSKYAPRIR